jgi:predicted O-linked N-acetylglucosamine transferase (SPINDLY family)
VDYLVADHIVVPDHLKSFYSENVARLPNSYWPNDTHLPRPVPGVTRAEVGLPPSGFVFCCFNGNYKITPPIFERWMSILKKVEGSVLWLLEGTPETARNLRAEAARRGVGGERLIFAPRAPLAEHLNRHLLADLFLDTVPCNAHTTASDALWCGLPVLTCMDRSFASRVAASLVSALGMADLVTADLAEYETRALDLALDAGKLAEVKERLLRNRDSAPLFDAQRSARAIESAYASMYERFQQGHPPASFDIAA